MKTVFLLFLLHLSLSAGAQHNDGVYLRWKLAPGETVVYHTTMANQETAAASAPKDSLGSVNGLLQQLLKSRPGSSQNNELLSYLRPVAGGGIAIEMTSRPLPDSMADKNSNTARPLSQLGLPIQPAVVLRGAINAAGGIGSFYLKTEQKNLLALLFQLPLTPIQKGDSWPLELNLVFVDQSFRCDSSYRRNKVTCTNIASRNSETIATVDYDIEEFVTGEMSAFSMTGQKTTMKITYRGSAEFSVTRGRWQRYEAVMNIVTGGFMASNTSKKIALVP
jgi:hypothetical protein